ncbi:peptidase C15 [Picosynechococcus sp. PCC 7117]|uniref:pyroglutamyl-peptidase I family protein n=1 Tax=Picosynechococcus sp. PCC 7117 TaxID=195498 RepID=UPI000810878E|nr:peptidase C15 [Picosynechococcus sp. PCC 7117]ANV87297.1 peptidase C15 [Picosynechococcus sp. PCC 7117]
MRGKILLTSFQPWLEHHTSNASDDLLCQLKARRLAFADFLFLHHLPVETAIASAKTIQAIAAYQPDLVLCCGMAEKRDRLTIESQAFYQGQQLQTRLDLQALTTPLEFTEISDDAGKFVCEGLYFQVLKHLQWQQSQARALFLHVPLLTAANRPLILRDVETMLHWLLHNVLAFPIDP